MEGTCDDGLDVPSDDMDEVMNALGDVDGDLNDLEDELLNFDYMAIAKAELSEPKSNVDTEARHQVFTTEVEACESLRGVDGRETIRRVTVCGKSS